MGPLGLGGDSFGPSPEPQASAEEFQLSAMRGAPFGGHDRNVTLRCLLVDDNGGFLEAARRLLERDGIDVVGVATTGTDAMVQVSELHPDVVLVDVHLGAENGLDAARRLIQTSESMSVILISPYDE